MLRCVRSVTLAAAIGAALALVASAAVADIDASGRWVIRGLWLVDFPPFHYVAVDVWSQTGTALTTSAGFTGTIDTTTGAVSMTRSAACAHPYEITGTVAADGLSLTGEEYFPSVASFCLRPANLVEITGSRCPSGTIEPGEGCDDGNTFDGDGCDNLCNVEACWSCTGTPSTCVPLAVCPTCSNGAIDPGEGCDDGNILDGDGCDHACAIEPCWQCGGAPSFCAPQSPGTPCTDGDAIACTVNATCSAAHACVATPDDSLCDDGDTCTVDTCNPTAGCVVTPISCDDGNPCTADTCSGSCLHTPMVRNDCRSAPLSTLVLKSAPDAASDSVNWTWQRGVTPSQDFADPRSGATYRFCVFAGSEHSTIAATSLAPDAQRWRSTRKGFGYRQSQPAPGSGGLRRVDLIGDAVDRAKIVLKGTGALLDVAAPPFGLPVTAQLLNTQSNICWEATYEAADVRQNSDRRFSVRAGP